jgi:hypothetical protein
MSMRAPKSHGKKTAFVPKIIFKAATVASVIPFCAACGGQVVGQQPDAADDVVILGVARLAYDGGVGGDVATIGFDASDSQVFGVAVECFDGSGDPCNFDAGVADVGFSDAKLGVALDAFSTKG